MSNELTTTQEKPLATRPEQSVVEVGERGLVLNSLEDMWRLAKMVVNSGLYKDLPSPEVAMVKMQSGAELGLSYMRSLSSIYVINGKPTVYGDAFLAIVKAHPSCEDVIETTEGAGETLISVCEVRRKGQVPVVRRFSIADAKKAGLWAKAGPWSQYPSRMLQMRARSWACRDAFPDALCGMSMREEHEDIEPRPVRGRVVSSEMILEEAE